MEFLKHIILCALCVAFGGLEAGEVRLVDTIAVRAPTVTLGEIATIKVDDPAVERTLAAIEIVAAPRLGTTRTISAFKVKSLLQRHGHAGVAVHGLKSTVRTEERLLEDAELRSIIESWVHSQTEDSEEVDIEVTRLPYKWTVPAGDQLSISVQSSQPAPTGQVSVTLRAQVGDQILSSQRAQVTIRRYRTVPVVVQPLVRGEVITEEHIETQRQEVKRVNGMEIRDITTILGLAAKRNLPAGVTPKITDFEKPVLIERGDASQIVVENGSVRVKVSGAIALQDGKEGDSIMFSNPVNQQETLRARVVRRGVALLKLN